MKSQAKETVKLVDLGWVVARITLLTGYFDEDGEFQQWFGVDTAAKTEQQPVSLHIIQPADEGMPAQSVYIGSHERLKMLYEGLKEVFVAPPSAAEQDLEGNWRPPTLEENLETLKYAAENDLYFEICSESAAQLFKDINELLAKVNTK